MNFTLNLRVFREKPRLKDRNDDCSNDEWETLGENEICEN